MRSNGAWQPRYWPVWLLVGIVRLAVYLPYRWQMALGRGCGRSLYRLLKRQRHIAETNLRLCFPELAPDRRRLLLRRSFESLGMMLFEMPFAWWGPESAIRRMVEVEGFEHLSAALRGGGVILLSAHFTTLEIGGRLFRTRHPLHVSFRTDKNPLVDRVLRAGRERLFETVIPREDVRALVRCLRQGHVLWFAPDENFSHRSRVFAEFMGVPAATNPATARFAKLGEAAVVPFVAIRRADGAGYRLVFLPALECFPGDDPVADARRINAEIERLIRLAPEQYLWIQKRFWTRPAGAAPVYGVDALEAE